MKIEAPILSSQVAIEDLIDTTISNLKAAQDNFAILSKNKMSYIQCLRTEAGFIVQFQLGSLNKHYQSVSYPSRPQKQKVWAGLANGRLLLLLLQRYVLKTKTKEKL